MPHAPKKFFKTISYVFLIVVTMNLTACSMVQPMTDAVLWLPKKVFITWPAAALKKVGIKPFEDKNNWQDDLELGPRRQPGANPMGGAPMGGYPQQGNPQGYMPSAPQGAYPYPPSQYNQQQFGTPQFAPHRGYQPQGGNYRQPPSGYGGGYQPQQNPYGSPPQQASPYPGGSRGFQQPQGNPYGQQQQNPYGGNYAQPPSGYGGTPAQSSPYSGGYQQPPQSGGFGGMPPQGGSFGGMPDMPGDGQYGVPPYAQDYKEPSPFNMGQHKLIRKFEPMAMEVYMEEGSEEELDENLQPLDLEAYMHMDEKELEKKTRRKASMFPLDEFAPKSNVEIQEFSQPKIINQKQIDADIKSLIKRLEGGEKNLDTTNKSATQAKNIDADAIAIKGEEVIAETIDGVELPSSLPPKGQAPRSNKNNKHKEVSTIPPSKQPIDLFAVEQEPKLEENKQPTMASKKATKEEEKHVPVMSQVSSPEYAIVPPPSVNIKNFGKKHKDPLLNSRKTIYKGILPKSRYSD